MVEQHDPVATPNLKPDRWNDLPGWGKVLIFAGLTFGMGSAGLASVAKVLGLQTAAQAVADKVELKADIAALKVGQQAANEVDATNHAAVLKAIEEIKAAQSRQGSRIEQVRSLIKRRGASGGETTP